MGHPESEKPQVRGLQRSELEESGRDESVLSPYGGGPARSVVSSGALEEYGSPQPMTSHLFINWTSHHGLSLYKDETAQPPGRYWKGSAAGWTLEGSGSDHWLDGHRLVLYGSVR